jgi:5-methylcytosine-specific restriction endonuclease McrA
VLYQRRHQELAFRTGERALDPPTMAQQRADALALVAESALHAGLDPGAPGERYQVVLHVDAGALAETSATQADSSADAAPSQSLLEDGTHVSAGTSMRLTCDASRIVMRHDEKGRVVEVGARTRTISPALRRALQHRDGGCRFPGCGVRVAQGHHLRHWAHGGPTTLSNLALLCRRHHRAVHEEGYRVERTQDERLRFSRPDGREVPDVPTAAAVPADPVASLRGAGVGRGVAIDARTNLPYWLGERLDLGYAIDVLHPLARKPAPAGWGPDPVPKIEAPRTNFCGNDEW